MSIANELNRIIKGKVDLATALAARGVTVPSGTRLDGYAALVGKIGTSGATPVVLEAGDQRITVAQPAGETRTVWHQRSDAQSPNTWLSVTGKVPFAITGLSNGQEYRVNDGSGPRLMTPAAPVAAPLILNANFDSDADPRAAQFIASWEAGALTSSVGSRVWRPSLTLVPAASTGCLIAAKSGSRPACAGFADFRAFVGQRVAILAEMALDDQSPHIVDSTGSWITGSAPAFNSELTIHCASDAAGSTHEIIPSETSYLSAGHPNVRRATVLEHTVIAEKPFLGMRSRCNTSTGAVSGGHPNCTRFIVARHPYDFKDFAWRV
jgi:hypothetical protein